MADMCIISFTPFQNSNIDKRLLSVNKTHIPKNDIFDSHYAFPLSSQHRGRKLVYWGCIVPGSGCIYNHDGIHRSAPARFMCNSLKMGSVKL